MTPKLRLRAEARKTLLSWILKPLFPGSLHISRSIQMTEAPTMQAVGELAKAEQTMRPGRSRWEHAPMPLTMHMIHPRVSLSKAQVPGWTWSAIVIFVSLSCKKPKVCAFAWAM